MASSNFNVLNHSLRQAATLSAGIATLFILGSFGCLYFVNSRGAFGSRLDEHVAELKPGSVVDVQLSPSTRGDRDVEIWYPRHASDDISKAVTEISGKATLRSDGFLITEVNLPVIHTQSDRDGVGMVLFTEALEPRNHYKLSLQIDRMPTELAGVRAVVKTEMASMYPLIFWQIEGLAMALFVVASLGAFLSIRWWRVAASPQPDQQSMAQQN